jgi:hypothetical protein
MQPPDALLPAADPSKREDKMGSRALARETAKEAKSPKKAKSLKAHHTGAANVHPIGEVQENGDEDILSVSMFVKKFGPLIGIITIAAVMTQKSDISSVWGLFLLIAQACLAVLGVFAWMHKPRT